MYQDCMKMVNMIPIEFLQLMEDRKEEFNKLIISLSTEKHNAFNMAVAHADGVSSIDDANPEERAAIEKEMLRLHGTFTLMCMLAWRSVIDSESKEQAHEVINSLMGMFDGAMHNALAYRCVSEMPKN